MSATLPESAPIDTTAVPSVEAPAPASGSAVAEESVGSGEPVVPADRFNGLMSKFNQTQSALEAANTRLAELEARLNGSEQQQEFTPPVSDNSALEAQVNELRQLLVEERIETARAQALKDYPEAAPFADLIVADTPNDVREMARLIAERAKTVAPSPSPVTEAEGGEQETPPAVEATTQTPVVEAPVAGGGAAFSGEASAEDRVVTAIQKGSFSDFLNAKWEARAVAGDGMNLG